MRLSTERKRRPKSPDMIRPVEDESVPFSYERDVPSELRKNMEAFAEEKVRNFSSVEEVNGVQRATHFLRAIGKQPPLDMERAKKTCSKWASRAENQPSFVYFDASTDYLFAFLLLDPAFRPILKPFISHVEDKFSTEALQRVSQQEWTSTDRTKCMVAIILFPERRHEIYPLVEAWFPGHKERLLTQYQGGKILLEDTSRIAYGRFTGPQFTGEYQTLVKPHLPEMIKRFSPDVWTLERGGRDIDYDAMGEGRRNTLIGGALSLIEIFADEFEMTDSGEVKIEPQKRSLQNKPELPERAAVA